MSDNSDITDEIKRKKDKIFDDVLKLITEELKVSPTDIYLDMDIVNDLQFDSMQIYELIIELEESYDIRLSDDLIDKIKTIRDVVETVYMLTAS